MMMQDERGAALVTALPGLQKSLKVGWILWHGGATFLG